MGSRLNKVNDFFGSAAFLRKRKRGFFMPEKRKVGVYRLPFFEEGSDGFLAEFFGSFAGVCHCAALIAQSMKSGCRCSLSWARSLLMMAAALAASPGVAPREVVIFSTLAIVALI